MYEQAWRRCEQASSTHRLYWCRCGPSGREFGKLWRWTIGGGLLIATVQAACLTGRRTQLLAPLALARHQPRCCRHNNCLGWIRWADWERATPPKTCSNQPGRL